MKPSDSESDSSLEDGRQKLVRQHLLAGWGGLFVFACLGILLEALLAYKVGEYVHVQNVTRRLMWRLAHAHGTLLSLVQLGLAFTFTQLRTSAFEGRAILLSRAAWGSLILVPGGFFLAGISAVAGDPGALIVFVPAGALLMIVASALAFTLSRNK